MPKLEEYTSFALGESLEQLDPDVLPKEKDVMRYIVYLFDVSRSEVKKMDTKKRNAAVCNIVVGALEEIWKNKSLPTRSHGAVYWLVDSLVKRVEFVKVSKNNYENNAIWIQAIVEQHNKIFDIAEKPVEANPAQVINQDEAMDIDLPESVEEEVVLTKRIPKPPKRFQEVIILSKQPSVFLLLLN